MTIQDKLESLPVKLLENVSQIKLHGFPHPENPKVAGLVLPDSDVVHIFKINITKNSYLNTIVHELTHVLDFAGQNLYSISNNGKWEKAFNKDKEHMINQGFKIENDGFVSDYALDIFNKATDKNNMDYSFESRFAEDLADAVPLYLNDKENFMKKYPNRAKLLEEILEV